MFERRTIPLPDLAALSSTGGLVELRELGCSELDELVASANASNGKPVVAVLAQTLHVDGAAIGAETLNSLPGRFYVALGQARVECMRLYGWLPPEGAPDADTAAPKD